VSLRRTAGQGRAMGRTSGLRRTAGLTGAGIAACASLAALSWPASAAVSRPSVASRPAATTPDDFIGGTDSSNVTLGGSAPYQLPAIGGSYGGYIGMLGNWAGWQGCNGALVYSGANASAAQTNFGTYHTGIGVGTYWFMGGPGVDPHFNGRDAEAAAWGADQAAAALADMNKLNPRPNYPVVFMDVELPGNAPAYTPASDNGWTSVYTSACSGQVRRHGINPQVDRAEFNGFADYLTAHSSYKAGVYSAPSIWSKIFGKYGGLSNTYEWTYKGDTSSLSSRPDGWCLAGTSNCAQFFGGMSDTSKYALMWQWSGGGGTDNGYGDFDQIDTSRTP
jgi:hypothetical protein